MSICKIPPADWSCTRASGHEGPCAAVPASKQLPIPPLYWREGMGKYGSSLSFEGGLLLINIAGYGDRDGLGQIAFKPEDVKEDGEGYLCVVLPNSELIAIRDHLNKWFPLALAQVPA